MTESESHKRTLDYIEKGHREDGHITQREAPTGRGGRADLTAIIGDRKIEYEAVKSHCPDRDGLLVDLKESRLRRPINQNSKLISDVLSHLKNNGIELKEGKYIDTFTLKHAIADVRSPKPKKISECIKSLLDGHYIKESGFVCEVLKI